MRNEMMAFATLRRITKRIFFFNQDFPSIRCYQVELTEKFGAVWKVLRYILPILCFKKLSVCIFIFNRDNTFKITRFSFWKFPFVSRVNASRIFAETIPIFELLFRSFFFFQKKLTEKGEGRIKVLWLSRLFSIFFHWCPDFLKKVCIFKNLLKRYNLRKLHWLSRKGISDILLN